MFGRRTLSRWRRVLDGSEDRLSNRCAVFFFGGTSHGVSMTRSVMSTVRQLAPHRLLKKEQPDVYEPNLLAT